MIGRIRNSFDEACSRGAAEFCEKRLARAVGPEHLSGIQVNNTRSVNGTVRHIAHLADKLSGQLAFDRAFQLRI